MSRGLAVQTPKAGVSRWVRRGLAALAVIVVLGAAGFAAIAWRSEVASIAPLPRATFDQKDIERGAALAAIGNCNVCHTTPGGKFYAGGRALPTPFGTIYATNITPDPATGIGGWSEDAFRRALRTGVARDGHHLYPVFPYDHFIYVTDADAHALYAFLMTRAPVSAQAKPNDLRFPFSWRPILAGWKLLYLRHDGFKPEASQSADWNRGGYLVEGLAHCGACHTPRNAEGAEKHDQKFAGGSSEGWNAPARRLRPCHGPRTSCLPTCATVSTRHTVPPPDRWRLSRTIWRARRMPTCVRSQPMWRAWRARRPRGPAGQPRNRGRPRPERRPPPKPQMQSLSAPAAAVTRVRPARWRSTLPRRLR